MAEISKVFRAAIIGTGRIASTYDDEVVNPPDPSFYRREHRHAGLYTILPVSHAASYKSTPGFELVAAANRGQEKLVAFGERWAVRALYTDFREMVRQEQPDIVSVCTQSPEKAEITIAAAEAGVKAVVVEKAMATSMAEAEAMIAACERNNTFLAVNHPYRFSPLIRRTRQLIEEGAIGPLTNVTAHALGGMLHVGTHVFDLLRFWAGDALTVTAEVPNYEAEKDLPARGMIHFASGATGFFDHTHGSQPSLEARGSGGYLTASTLVGDGWLYRYSPMYAAGAARKYPNRLMVEPIEAEPHRASTTQQLFAELYTTLATGAPFLSTGRDGAAALELGLACYLSHLAAGPVQLPLEDRAFRVPNR
jgi:predicted dehydrogenase